MSERKTAKPPARRTTVARTGVAGFTLTTAWAAALFALLVVLFFHEVVVGGKTFVSPDTTAPAGFVRMGEQTLYQDHEYPLWNPYVFLGMPSFASGAYNPLIYPPDWPVAIVQKLLPFLPELTWMLIYYFLGGLFMYLVAREWGARPEGALLGAVSFVFAPNLIAVGSHGHGSQLVNSAYVPLMMWLVTRWMRYGKISDLGWLALAGGFQLLRGHVQICFYTWIGVGLYAAAALIAGARATGPGRAAHDSQGVSAPTRVIRFACVGAAALLAFGVAGFYNLPLRDYAQYSIRGGSDAAGGVGMDYATAWSFAPYELPSIVVPGWTGFGGATYWGGMPFTDYPNAYVGMVTVALAVCAVFATGWQPVFALVLAVFALMISFGHFFPLYGALYDHLPLFKKFRIPVMIVLLFQLAAAAGLAWGWSAVLDRAGTKRERRAGPQKLVVGMAVVLCVTLVAGVLAQDMWRDGYIAAAVSHRGAQGYTPELGAIAYRGFVGDLGRACAYGLLALGAAWLALRSRLAPAAATVLVLALLMIELWPVSGKLMLPVLGDPVQRSLDQGRDDVVEFLEKAGPPGTFRILPIDEFQNNRFAGFGIASVGGYHAAKPRRIQDFIDAQLISNLGWMRLLNVKYLVARQKFDPATTPFLKIVHEGSSNVYENLLALPRATLLGEYRVVRPAKAILDSVKNGASESERVTYLEEDPHLTLGPVAGGAAVVSSYRLNQVVVDVDTPGPALLRLADAWYPDWTARVDDRPVPIYAADYLLRAVPVPAGKHRIEFRFESKSVATGLAVSIVSLVVALVLLGVGLIMGRNRRDPEDPTPASSGAPHVPSVAQP